MATATSPKDALSELLEEFTALVQSAIDHEREEVGDCQPKRVTLEDVGDFDAVPLNLYHRALTPTASGRSVYERPIWSATLEDSDELNGKRFATYRIFYHS